MREHGNNNLFGNLAAVGVPVVTSWGVLSTGNYAPTAAATTESKIPAKLRVSFAPASRFENTNLFAHLDTYR